MVVKLRSVTSRGIKGTSLSVDQDEFQKKLPNGVTLVRLILDGGQRQVFEADSNGTRVVIKLMPEADRNRAEREVLIGSTFDHPNLPLILDDEVCDIELAGDGYIWFRELFIEGGTLADRVGNYDPCRALSLAADLIEAVSYLWDRHSVVHRDIKPQNIMVQPDGTFVLIDVGIGRHQADSSITTGLLGPGTNGYVAPEQLNPSRARKLDARTDLFLIGIVTYLVLCGRLPFRPEQADYGSNLMAGQWPRLNGLPASVEKLLERLLGTRPHRRPSLDQARKMVRDAKEELHCS
jgi:serine/threonine protein kinase